ncbi:MAG TPA: hypothetical protein VLW53_12840 [Candidatus Eisenbacteria bacterium]|nr:hypothetical protein [Candidatus Eisenbacteria bacterium]
MGRSRWRALAALAALPLMAAACSGTASNDALAGQAGKPKVPVLHEATDSTIAISDTSQGYTFDSDMTALPADQIYRFRILRPDGKPQMDYLWDQTKLLHFLAVRNDFTNFAHVHPTMAPDGTWSVHLPLNAPGPYQLYVDFLLKDSQGLPRHLVLRRPLGVAGPYQLSPVVPAPSTSGEADGYRITFLKQPKPWTVMLLPARVTRTDGTPVTDLEPYLAVFAHFTSFNVANDLYGHAHPLEYAGAGREGWPAITTFRGGPTLTFHAEFPGAGDYRAFVEFQIGGQLHTAALTMRVQ